MSFRWRMPLCHCQTGAQETNVYLDSIKRLNAFAEPRKTPKEPEVTAPYELQVKDLVYAYADGHHNVLNGVNLKISPGEKLAILGRSGSGKSTLASLLRGDLTPTAGSVTLNAIKTTEFGDEIAKYIGVIHQTPYLFNTTVVNNVRIGNEGASDEEVWDVLERVGLKN